MNRREGQSEREHIEAKHRVLPVVYDEMGKYFAVQAFCWSFCLRRIDVRYWLGCRFYRCYDGGGFD